MKKRILAFFLAGILAFPMGSVETSAASMSNGTIAAKELEDGAEEPDGQKEAADIDSQEVFDEAGQGNSKDGSQEAFDDAGQEISDDGRQEAFDDAGQEISGDGRQKAFDDAGQEISDDGRQEILDEGSRRILDEDSQEKPEEEEPSGLVSEEEGMPQQQSIEEWTPPMGGLERPQMIEISEETAESLGVMDVEEGADGEMMYRSAVLGSQKYNSPWDVYSTNYIYNRLSQNERNFWDALDEVLRGYMSGMENAGSVKARDPETGGYELYYVTGKGPSYTYFNLTRSRAEDLFLMFNYSNPQYYFLGNGCLLSESAMFPIIYDAFANGSARAAETAKMKAQIDAMVSQVKAGKTAVEKAKIAHDLICEKVFYDHDYQTNNPHTIYHQSAYSVFCENYTVCAGYTKAFTILMNGAGVDAISLTSYAHAWNMVCLNDSWYHIDCTWDDTDGAAYGEMVYQYFNRSTSKITGELDQNSYHQPEPFYQGVMPAATQDSGATVTSIGTIGTPAAKAAAPKIFKWETAEGIGVTLSVSTPGADIYYTLDGMEPSSASSRSFRYTGAFEVEHGTTVKAIAVCDTMWDSPVASATLKKKTYTVKFNTRGYGTISSKKVISGKTVKKPSSPKRSKYTFEGWYTSTKYTKKWNFGQAVTKDMTLYAKWKKVSVGKASIKKLTNVSGKKIKVNINKATGAKGYQIRYAANSKMKSAKSVSSTSVNKTLSKLKKNKRYYIQVRAYKKDSKGSKVYGAWSKKKAVTVRK